MKKEKQLWEDFLFENRNKAYGAYELRTTADRNLLKALLTVVFILGLVVLAFSSSSNETPVIYDNNEPPVYILEKIETEKTEIPPERTVEKAKVVVTVNEKSGVDITPVPTDSPKVETPISKQEDLGIAEGPEDNGDADDMGAYNPVGDSNTGQQDLGNGQNQTEIPMVDKAPEIANVRQVTKMAVFPGCENAGKTKKELTDCMSAKLSLELSEQLRDFEDIAGKNNITKANALLNFVVDKSGKIVKIQTVKGGDSELSKEAQKALDRISKKLIQKGKYIQPAEMDDGTVVNMIFSIPVRYNGN